MESGRITKSGANQRGELSGARALLQEADTMGWYGGIQKTHPAKISRRFSPEATTAFQALNALCCCIMTSNYKSDLTHVLWATLYRSYEVL